MESWSSTSYGSWKRYRASQFQENSPVQECKKSTLHVSILATRMIEGKLRRINIGRSCIGRPVVVHVIHVIKCSSICWWRHNSEATTFFRKSSVRDLNIARCCSLHHLHFSNNKLPCNVNPPAVGIVVSDKY